MALLYSLFYLIMKFQLFCLSKKKKKITCSSSSINVGKQYINLLGKLQSALLRFELI